MNASYGLGPFASPCVQRPPRKPNYARDCICFGDPGGISSRVHVTRPEQTQRRSGVQARSKGEAALGTVLSRMGLAYRYEPRLTLYDHFQDKHRWVRPDYVLDGSGVVIEYAGMLDIPEYRARHEYKSWLYDLNGIRHITVTPSDLSSTALRRSLLERILDAQAGLKRPYE